MTGAGIAGGGLLAPLGAPAFRKLWFAGFGGSLGRWTDVLVLSWVALLLTDSVWLVAVAGFLRHLPMLVLSASIGSAADRFGRAAMARTGMALNSAACACLALAFWLNVLSYPLLLVGALVLGVGLAIDMTVRRALLADLSTREQLLSAVSLEMLTMNVTRVVGPIMAGGLLAVVGGGAGYAVSAALYGAAAFFLWGIPSDRRGAGDTGQGIPAGTALRRLLGEEAVTAVLVITVFMNILVFPYQQILSVFARDVLGVDAFGFGLLSAADALGSSIGILLLARFPRTPQGWVFLGSSLGMPAVLIIFTQTTTFPLALAALMAFGLTHAGFSTMQSAIVLHAAPSEVRGRAGGWLSMAIGTGPLGMLAVGSLAAATGAAAAVAVGAAAAILLVGGSGVRYRAFRRYRW